MCIRHWFTCSETYLRECERCRAAVLGANASRDNELCLVHDCGCALALFRAVRLRAACLHTPYTTTMIFLYHCVNTALKAITILPTLFTLLTYSIHLYWLPSPWDFTEIRLLTQLKRFEVHFIQRVTIYRFGWLVSILN